MILVHDSGCQPDGGTFRRRGQVRGRQQQRVGLSRDGVVVCASRETVDDGLDDVDLSGRPVVHGPCLAAAARVAITVAMIAMSLRGTACVLVQVQAAHHVPADDGQHKEHDSRHGRCSMPGTGQKQAEAACRVHGGHYWNG